MKAKAEAPSKEAAVCTDCREAAAADKAGKGDVLYCKIHRTKGHDLQECYQIEQLIKSSSLRGREQNMRSVTRKRVRMLLAVRARVVK